MTFRCADRALHGVALIIIGIRFIRFRAEYYKREELLRHIERLNELLPEATSPEQEQWLTIIAELNEQCRQADLQLRNERTNMLDYFTVWVHQIKMSNLILLIVWGYLVAV